MPTPTQRHSRLHDSESPFVIVWPNAVDLSAHARAPFRIASSIHPPPQATPEDLEALREFASMVNEGLIRFEWAPDVNDYRVSLT